MDFTGEQVIEGVGKQRLFDEAEERYKFAQTFVKGKRVLDAACGTGQGTFMLAQHAAQVDGLDLSDDAIAFAQNRYPSARISFIRGSVTDRDLFSKETFDVIISFETIEHLSAKDRISYLNNIHRWLKKDGRVIFSTPNKLITSPFSKQPLNKFHTIEFTQSELLRELNPFFVIKNMFGQRRIWWILTIGFVRRTVHVVERIIGTSFQLYTRSGTPKVLPLVKGFVPRILIADCTKK